MVRNDPETFVIKHVKSLRIILYKHKTYFPKSPYNFAVILQGPVETTIDLGITYQNPLISETVSPQQVHVFLGNATF